MYNEELLLEIHLFHKRQNKKHSLGYYSYIYKTKDLYFWPHLLGHLPRIGIVIETLILRHNLETCDISTSITVNR